MTRQIAAVCPECGYEIDDASGVGEAKDRQPEPENLSVCIRCAGLSIYIENEDGTLGLRALTAEEKAEADQDEEVTKARSIVILMTQRWMND